MKIPCNIVFAYFALFLIQLKSIQNISVTEKEFMESLGIQIKFYGLTQIYSKNQYLNLTLHIDMILLLISSI